MADGSGSCRMQVVVAVLAGNVRRVVHELGRLMWLLLLVILELIVRLDGDHVWVGLGFPLLDQVFNRVFNERRVAVLPFVHWGDRFFEIVDEAGLLGGDALLAHV